MLQENPAGVQTYKRRQELLTFLSVVFGGPEPVTLWGSQNPSLHPVPAVEFQVLESFTRDSLKQGPREHLQVFQEPLEGPVSSPFLSCKPLKEALQRLV